jgi:hypothetical protein
MRPQQQLELLDIVQFCFVGGIRNALVEWRDALVAGHHDDGTKFQALGQAHLRGTISPARTSPSIATR